MSSQPSSGSPRDRLAGFFALDDDWARQGGLERKDLVLGAVAVLVSSVLLELMRSVGAMTSVHEPLWLQYLAVVWRYLFHVRYGWINQMLGAFGVDAIDWLGDPHWSMPAIIVFAAWKNFGGNMIIFVAALQAIPADLYEAAKLDGASRWQQFRHVTVPMLGPTLLLVSVLTMAGYFQLFAEPYVMTQGGPLQSTVSVLYLMYEEGFRWWNLGTASAVAFLLFVLMVAVTQGLLWVGRRRGGVVA